MEELYKTKEGRLQILHTIIKNDNVSIAEIVKVKENAMQERFSELNTIASGLGLRATAIFGIKPKDILENIELVKPLVAKDIIKLGIVKGTAFEKELLERYDCSS